MFLDYDLLICQILSIINFAPNTQLLFDRLKYHKQPLKIWPFVNKRLDSAYDLEINLKQISNKFLPSSNLAISSAHQFIDMLKDFKSDANDYRVHFDTTNLYPLLTSMKFVNRINKKITDFHDDDYNVFKTLQSASNWQTWYNMTIVLSFKT